jgi:hypothetical protein
MYQFFDEKFSHRVSDILKEKIRSDLDGPGFIARGVLEAIRLLEGESVAQSTKAMRHKERELKGDLAGFYHIHVAEDHLSRVMNNFGEKKHRSVKKPQPDEVISHATKEVIKAYLKKHNIPYSQDDTEHLVDAIHNSSHAKKVGIDKVFSSIQQQIPLMIDKVFFSNNKVTGDWLIYKKHTDGNNYYLDFTSHINSLDTHAQGELKNTLNKSFTSLTTTHF